MIVRWRCSLCSVRGESHDYAAAQADMTAHYVDVHGPQAWADYQASRA